MIQQWAAHPPRGASLQKETDQILGSGSARPSRQRRHEQFDTIMDHFASLLVGEALNMTHGNRSQAAKLLALPSYAAFQDRKYSFA